jgi:hypothetical protein
LTGGFPRRTAPGPLVVSWSQAPVLTAGG